MGFLKIFFNEEKLAETNRKYHERMAEIHEKEEATKQEIATRKATMNSNFKNNMAENTRQYHERIAEINAKENA